MFRSPDPRIAQLAEVGLFRGCNRSDLHQLARITSEIAVDAGEVLCREGWPGSECYVVLEGHADVSIAGEPVGTIGAGGFFGEMALLDCGPRVATVTAGSNMRLLVMSRAEFATMLTRVPSVSRKMLQALGSRLRVADRQLHPVGPCATV